MPTYLNKKLLNQREFCVTHIFYSVYFVGQIEEMICIVSSNNWGNNIERATDKNNAANALSEL